MSLKVLDDAKIQYRVEPFWIDNPETENGTPRIRKQSRFLAEVLLPFSAQEWMDLLSIESDRGIGGCCGNLSQVRSVLFGVFGEGGWIRAKELGECALTLRNHEVEIGRAHV